MNAIPEPTREDFGHLAMGCEYLYGLASEESIDGEDPIDRRGMTLSLTRLLAHFQRENERLARQRDVLREWLNSEQISSVRYQHAISERMEANTEHQAKANALARLRIDALTGEGGAA